jgi:hypothetical protein
MHYVCRHLIPKVLTSGQQESAKLNRASTIFLGLTTARLSPISGTKNCSERQRIASAMEVTAKLTRALTEVLQNGLRECFQILDGRCQNCVTAKGNNSEGNVV